MKQLCVVMFACCALLACFGQSADEYYVRIYNIIQEADTLAGNLQHAPALQRYRDARRALESFEKGNPGWNTAIIRFRLAYLDERIAQLAQQVPAEEQKPAAPAQAATVNNVNPPVGTALEAQVAQLQEQVRALQADRKKLEAKLKEALSVQPAAADPREIAKAEQRIQALQKENDLLKVNVEQLRNKPAESTGVAAALAAATQKLNEQTERVKNLELEKTALENKLRDAAAAVVPEKPGEQKASTDELAELKGTVLRLNGERDALQAKLNALNQDAQTLVALRSENELLKKQIGAAQAKTMTQPTLAPGTPAKSEELEKQLASLKSDKEILLLEKQALQGKVKQLQSATNLTLATAIPQQPPTREETRRIRELEKERDSLLKKLADANRQLADRKGGSTRVQELQTELTSIRQRLGILEAEKVPYTEEELALFRVPEPTMATEPPKSAPAPRKFSASVAGLAAEGQRQFKEGRLEDAEQKFQEVLKQDNTDVVTLANLATVQIARKDYADAEKNIQRALQIAPQDSFTVALLGRLRFEQGKHDEAFEALGKAANLDPKNAEIQNYLGLVLSEKGMRAPAETALRKAIQLKPDYGSAHQNLAVIYLTQTPPLVELAKYHYQKSLASGTPRNTQLENLIAAKSPERK